MAISGRNAARAEFLGSFFLWFAGIAAILSATPTVGGGGGLVSIALAQGLALSVAVNVFGGVSGAHFNPAVTAGMLATRRIAGGLAGVYIVAQLAGATVAAGRLREAVRSRRAAGCGGRARGTRRHRVIGDRVIG